MTDVSGKRRKDSNFVDEFFVPKFHEPQWSAEALREFERAATAYAANNPSDPFAHDRALLHLKRGIMNLDECSRK